MGCLHFTGYVKSLLSDVPPMKDVLIHSPYSLDSSQGNTVSAERLERILHDAGLTISMEGEKYRGEDVRCLIALNARRSAEAVASFHAHQPDSTIVVTLTGTDINHPEAQQQGSATWQSMETADRLVLLHDASLAAVPEPFKPKCSVIYPSVTLPVGLQHHAEGDDFTIVMAGNMRAEKNPDLAVNASLMIPAHLNIHVYGDYSEPSSSRIIKHGMVPHGEMLTSMSKAHILLNTSTQEGGANAICEAISMGLPVVASGISGNVGMLGAGYAGLFSSNDIKGLVDRLTKAAKDQGFYNLLKKQVTARTPLFAYGNEAAAWEDLVRSQLSH